MIDSGSIGGRALLSVGVAVRESNVNASSMRSAVHAELLDPSR